MGTRNYWLVIPLVFCENRNIRVLQEAFAREVGFSKLQSYRRYIAELACLYREGKVAEMRDHEFAETSFSEASKPLFPNLDGVRFLTHEMGAAAESRIAFRKEAADAQSLSN